MSQAQTFSIGAIIRPGFSKACTVGTASSIGTASPPCVTTRLVRETRWPLPWMITWMTGKKLNPIQSHPKRNRGIRTTENISPGIPLDGSKAKITMPFLVASGLRLPAHLLWMAPGNIAATC